MIVTRWAAASYHGVNAAVAERKQGVSTAGEATGAR